MEGLAPPLKCLIEIQAALDNGESVRTGLLRYTGTTSDEFAAFLRRWLFAWDQGQDWLAMNQELRSPYRAALVYLISQGLSGQPVHGAMKELEIEIAQACDMEIKKYVDLLPVKMLVPLLLFQFPAFLLLLFGPILTQFLKELAR